MPSKGFQIIGIISVDKKKFWKKLVKLLNFEDRYSDEIISSSQNTD